jgi:hypothetical protein
VGWRAWQRRSHERGAAPCGRASSGTATFTHQNGKGIALGTCPESCIRVLIRPSSCQSLTRVDAKPPAQKCTPKGGGKGGKGALSSRTTVNYVGTVPPGSQHHLCRAGLKEKARKAKNKTLRRCMCINRPCLSSADLPRATIPEQPGGREGGVASDTGAPLAFHRD